MIVRNELPDESSAMLISIMKLEMSSVCEIQNIQDNVNWLWYFKDALHSTQERWSKDAGKLAAFKTPPCSLWLSRTSSPCFSCPHFSWSLCDMTGVGGVCLCPIQREHISLWGILASLPTHLHPRPSFTLSITQHARFYALTPYPCPQEFTL